jgi:hypothetical protein
LGKAVDDVGRGSVDLLRVGVLVGGEQLLGRHAAHVTRQLGGPELFPYAGGIRE